jgi:hypothetical protein
MERAACSISSKFVIAYAGRTAVLPTTMVLFIKTHIIATYHQ